LALIEARLGALVVAIVCTFSIVRRSSLVHECARLEAMGSAMLDALVRHCLVREHVAVLPCVSLLAKTNSIPAVAIVVAVHRTLLPLATIASVARIARASS